MNNWAVWYCCCYCHFLNGRVQNSAVFNKGLTCFFFCCEASQLLRLLVGEALFTVLFAFGLFVQILLWAASRELQYRVKLQLFALSDCPHSVVFSSILLPTEESHVSSFMVYFHCNIIFVICALNESIGTHLFQLFTLEMHFVAFLVQNLGAAILHNIRQGSLNKANCM